MLGTHPRRTKSIALLGMEEEKISFINLGVVGVGFEGVEGKKTQFSPNGNLIELKSYIDILIMLQALFYCYVYIKFIYSQSSALCM